MDVIRALENVLRIAPNRSQTLLLLGRARKAAGDDPGATEAFTRLRANWARADASVSAMLQ
jgi:cytochrome c-type biogenesis protein CcmH/NrfG